MERINATVDRIQSRFETLTPPRISNSLKSIAREGNINPDEIIALIQLEPLSAKRILREANQSPNLTEKGYSSKEQAATVVGSERMYDLLGMYSTSIGTRSKPPLLTALSQGTHHNLCGLYGKPRSQTQTGSA